MPTTYDVTLRGMRFHALVGILPHERIVPQPVEIDVTARLSAGEGVVDYRALYDTTAGVIGQAPIDFLEEIGERIAAGVLDHNSRIQSVRVAVRKPHVALGGPLEYAEVVVDRTADA